MKTPDESFIAEAIELNSDLGSPWPESALRSDAKLTRALVVASMLLDGVTHRKIGERISLSAGRVRDILHKLRGMLYRQLPDYANSSRIRMEREWRLLPVAEEPDADSEYEAITPRPPRGGELWTCIVPDGPLGRLPATIVEFEAPYSVVKVLIEGGRLTGQVRSVEFRECEDLKPPQTTLNRAVS